MKKSVATLFSILALFLSLAYLVGKNYKLSQDQPVVRYAHISEGVVNKLKKAFQNGMQNTIRYSSDGPWDWENEKDYGSRSPQWSKEEDAWFIIYYHKDKEAIWQERAQNILKSANANVLILKDVMGHYYYPEELNGRKLSIYLAQSEDDYINTIGQLGVQHNGNSLGVTITTCGKRGFKTEGIVLHPVCFASSAQEENGYKTVLLHEMTHFIHRSSIDVENMAEIYNWETEGIADYCSNRHKGVQISDPSKIDYIKKYCRLHQDFPSERLAQYWGGESFFIFLEQKSADHRRR